MIDRSPSERFWVTLDGGRLVRIRYLGGLRTAHLSPTILESTLSLLMTSPSPRSTNSTSCLIEAAYVCSRSRDTIRCPDILMSMARPAFAIAPMVNKARRPADACPRESPSGICYICILYKHTFVIWNRKMIRSPGSWS